MATVKGNLKEKKASPNCSKLVLTPGFSAEGLSTTACCGAAPALSLWLLPGTRSGAAVLCQAVLCSGLWICGTATLKHYQSKPPSPLPHLLLHAGVGPELLLV